ncbi:hypothetical protein AVEN_196441-1 [Araneus ventricosus]|uniref:Uncharacterized protein n=1 Tax=Araneus ventricosus TaxID=182803 RepID=A0A4Y2AV64_ARAVE|nr:hypothetical protein AVEN_196441-1 [Araneus ventricosus]
MTRFQASNIPRRNFSKWRAISGRAPFRFVDHANRVISSLSRAPGDEVEFPFRLFGRCECESLEQKMSTCHAQHPVIIAAPAIVRGRNALEKIGLFFDRVPYAKQAGT